MITMALVKSILKTLFFKLQHLNLFADLSTDPVIIRRQILTTRLFLVLFTIAISILILYTSIIKQTQIRTIQKPDEATFLRLLDKYPNTLDCPCENISIPYGRFFNVTPRFHRVCSSDFVSQKWIDFTLQSNLSRFLPMDVRLSISFFWRFIAGLCQSTAKSVSDAFKAFAVDGFLSASVFPKTYLETRIHNKLDQVQKIAEEAFQQDLNAVQLISKINAFISSILTNFHALSVLIDEYDLFQIWIYETDFTFSEQIGCLCHRGDSCRTPMGLYLYDDVGSLGFYSLDMYLPSETYAGIIFDCLPSAMVFSSTLECFHDRTCIDRILATYSDSINISIMIEDLNSRYPSDMALKEVIERLFIEEILTTTSYSAYYNACAPISCTYSYARRFDQFYIITTLIGLVGGLNISLRLVSKYVVKIFIWLKQRFSNRTGLKSIEISK